MHGAPVALNLPYSIAVCLHGTVGGMAEGARLAALLLGGQLEQGAALLGQRGALALQLARLLLQPALLLLLQASQQRRY